MHVENGPRSQQTREACDSITRALRILDVPRLAIGFSLCAAVVSCAPVQRTVPVAPAMPSHSVVSEMVAHFINVGQANASLLEFPCGAILIDAGAQDDSTLDSLASNLDAIFASRPDLNRTLDALFITHNHIDHTRALRTVAENFTVRRYFDNGQLEGLGTENPGWIRARGGPTLIRDITYSAVTSAPDGAGLTDGDIDPLDCGTINPRITLLHGRVDENPGWSPRVFENKNNHSIVIRVDFGEASFLFTGDLEFQGIDLLLRTYAHGKALDTDLYHVGHHGSRNATTAPLLDAISPQLAVISVGKWDFGLNSTYPFTTNAYGHPRRAIVDLLETAISGLRSPSVTVRVADGARAFTAHTVTKQVYATGWDGHLRVRASSNGTFVVQASN